MASGPRPSSLSFSRRAAAAAGVVAAAVVVVSLASDYAPANCALFAPSVEPLVSEEGAVDRPFAAPGDTVTVYADDACNPSATNPFFSPVLSSNQVTLVFEPPNGGPVTVVGPFAASAVSDCGTARCFALSFALPDTTNAGPMAGTGHSLTGPAAIEVRNTAASGAVVARIRSLFDPTDACNPQNRYRNLFERFTVLPPRTGYAANASATLLGTVDGSGSLLLPLDFDQVLASDAGGAAALRMLEVTGNLPNGLSAGNGLTGHESFIRVPRARGRRRFVRAFAFNGRPIPPLLEVTGTPLSAGGVSYGDKLVASVDFLRSVIRIAKRGPSPAGGGATLQLFALNGEQAGAPPGLSLENGAGPVLLPGISLAAGGAAPLSSLRASEEVTAVARDERLESRFPGAGQVNADGDSDDRVLEVTNLATGEALTTSIVVTDAGAPPRPAIATGGTLVAALESEPGRNADVMPADLDLLDVALRVQTADPGDARCSGTACELTPSAHVLADPALVIDGPQGRGPVATDGRFVFFGRNESSINSSPSFPSVLSRRAGGAASAGLSFEPAVSADGSTVAFVSTDPITPAPEVVFETGTYSGTVDLISGQLVGTFSFDPGDADVPGLDYSAGGSGSFNLQYLFIGFDTYQLWGTWSRPSDGLVAETLNDGSPGIGVMVQSPPPPPVIDTATGTSEAPIDTLTAPVDPSAFGLTNLSSFATADVVDGSVQPTQYDITGIFEWRGTASTAMGPQIFAASVGPTGAPSGQQLVSASAAGMPGNGPSFWPSLDASGNLVAFGSSSDNLVAPYVPGATDVFVKNRASGAIVRASQRLGAAGNAESRRPDLSSDGQSVAFESFATNLSVADGNDARDVFVTDLGTGAIEQVSLSSEEETPATGASGAAAISGDGRYVAFVSAAQLAPGDANWVEDIYLRDREPPGTTERVSVAVGGGDADGPSGALEIPAGPPFDEGPDLSADGRYVAFSSAATNLLPPGAPLHGVRQCYVRDRERGVTELVSRAAGGEGFDSACILPSLSPDGRFVSFYSDATNLGSALGFGTGTKLLVADRATGALSVVLESPTSRAPVSFDFSQRAAGLGGSIAGLPRLVVYSGEDHAPAFAPFPDTNLAEDVMAFVLTREGPSLSNFDTDGQDTVLFVLDTAAHTLTSTNLPVSKVAVAAGRAAVVTNANGLAFVVTPPFGAALMPAAMVDVALSDPVLCGIELGTSRVWVGRADAPGTSQNTGVAAEIGSLKAVGDKCVFIGSDKKLWIAPLDGAVESTGKSAVDFQVSSEGVAFRSAEVSVGDLNGDADAADNVMQLWRFVPEPPIAQPENTRRSAVLCKFPGCDPFFEPYRLQEGVLSFVTDERDEVHAGAVPGQRGATCLRTSVAGACDLTGDGDGDDVALQIFSVASGQVQTFPLSRELPPEVAPFPEVRQGADTVLVLQLPAVVLGTEFAALPPEQLVTVLVGDGDADGTFDGDGLPDPALSVVDNCPSVENAAQRDADGDGLGAGCDVTLASQGPGATPVVNDEPPSPTYVPPEPARVPGSMLCDLNKSGVIIRPEVDQVWADRGTPIAAPRDTNGDQVLDPADDRDPDADGSITASDFRACLVRCDAQAVGCPTTESGGSTIGLRRRSWSCGLLGIEALLALAPLAWRRRRRATAH